MSDELFLVKPSKTLEQEIWNYRQEYFDYGADTVNGSSGIAHFNQFDDWLEFVLAIEKDKLSRQHVHASTFFSMRKSDNRIIGSIQLRHTLTPELEKHGGHIGYGIRPTERGKGYGNQQLLLILDIARSMKLPKVLIICDADNIPSNKTALSCGGILSCTDIYEGKRQNSYWIELHS